ncbi:magnesium and cobalt transport protein CorA [Candidatus Parcubacteria bacterium]|nr:MAG: magnesium and cobalt transport protein CorA [Candidatus Parcubacteria bacterium]
MQITAKADQSIKKTAGRSCSKTEVEVISYGKDNYQTKKSGFDGCKPSDIARDSVAWINIECSNNDLIEKLSKSFDLHPLTSEDISNHAQRPKFEEFDDYFFISLKMINLDAQKDYKMEQLSLVVGKNYVISFQDIPGDLFGPIRERIKNVSGRHRKMGADYLTYTLIDAVIDGYFLVLEMIGEKISVMEEKLIKDPGPENVHHLHALKRKLLTLRKSVWPVREILAGIVRSESLLINKKTVIYFRNAYDHTIQVIDTLETFRDMVSGMIDIYLSSVSNRLNEVMKVLTIFASIFIPLTFIAGVYGMNFRYFPELNWKFGYLWFWIICLLISAVLIYFFKKRKWL